MKLPRVIPRDHRPDLKQFTLELITSGDGDVPLYLQVGNGNDADKAVFTEVIEQFKQQWRAAKPEVFVADSALYSQENLQALGTTPWITRVPATIAEASWLMQNLPPEQFIASCLSNYRIAEVCSTYAGVRQRWLVVESESRQQADLKQLDKRIAKAYTEKVNALKPSQLIHLPVKLMRWMRLTPLKRNSSIIRSLTLRWSQSLIMISQGVRARGTCLSVTPIIPKRR